MSEIPILSIVTVTFNDVLRLADTLDSIMEQDDQEFEYVVIDGASQDRTGELLQDYSKLRTIVALSERDHGLYDAMNKGLKLASGTYVLFLNAGDRLSSSDIVKELKKILLQSPDGVYSDVLVEYQNCQTRLKKAHDHHKISKGLPSSHQALVLRRKELTELKFDIKYRLAADLDLALRFYNQGHTNWVFLNVPIATVTAGGLSDVHRLEARKEILRILVKNGRPFQKVYGFGYQALFIGVDMVARFAKSRLSTQMYEKLTSWRRK